jgi:cytochrome bd-type quinol oxidase subunit 1
MELDPAFLSRLQFAFVVSFHIIFPAFTIGLAAWLATIEARGSPPAIHSTGACSTSG